jgi:solute carrier family 35 protein E1
MDAVISGILFYLYNELSFRVLNKVNPVTHAIANTIKRIVIILSSVLVFHNPINSKGQIGSALSIIGVFIYSICQSKFKNKSK